MRWCADDGVSTRREIYVQMLRIIQSTATLLCFSSLAGCGFFTTACEFTSETVDGDAQFYCWQDEYQDFCSNGGGVWHDNTSCKQLGYTNQCTEAEVAPGIQDEWTVAPGCDRSEAPPAGAASGGGGGTGGASGCGGPYTGPHYDDIQLETQCQNIWYNDCSAEAVAAGCEILDGWEAQGIPNVCPYCD